MKYLFVVSTVFFLNLALADDPVPAHPPWIDGPGRTVMGGDLMYLGIGEGKTAEIARFKSEAMAVKNLMSECTLAHKDTVLWDRYLEPMGDTYKAYARAGLDFQSCEEAKNAKGDQRKALANPVLMANQDLYNQLEFAEEHPEALMDKLKAFAMSLIGKDGDRLDRADKRLSELEDRIRSMERKPATVVHNTIVETKTVYIGYGGHGYKECVAQYNSLMDQAQMVARSAYPPGNLASPQAGPYWSAAMRKLVECRKMKK